jgi:uncharacterized integral membrane protein
MGARGGVLGSEGEHDEGRTAMSTGQPSPEPPDEATATESPSAGTRPRDNPLRSSVTARVWIGVVVLAVLLVLLVVFIAQNTEHVALRFLGWTWHPPLAVAILASIVGGLAVAAVAGTLRIWQLHRRVRRTR